MSQHPPATTQRPNRLVPSANEGSNTSALPSLIRAHTAQLTALASASALLATSGFNHSTVMGSSQWAKMKGLMLPLHVSGQAGQDKIEAIISENDIRRLLLWAAGYAVRPSLDPAISDMAAYVVFTSAR